MERIFLAIGEYNVCRHSKAPRGIPRGVQLSLVLVVQNDFSVLEPLINTFKGRRLDFDFYACTSSLSAARTVLASPYHLIGTPGPLVVSLLTYSA